MAQVDPPTDEEEEENIVITSLIWRRPIRVFWEKGEGGGINQVGGDRFFPLTRNSAHCLSRWGEGESEGRS